VHAQDRVGEVARRRRGRHESVHALFDQFDGRVVGFLDDDARSAVGGRLDDDQAVSLALRRKREARGVLKRMLNALGGNEAGRLDHLGECELVDQLEHPLALRPIAEDQIAQLRRAPPRLRDGGQKRRHAFLRDVSTGVDDERLGSGGLARLERPGVRADDLDLVRETFVAKPVRLKP
jgi:hypothetical protein